MMRRLTIFPLCVLVAAPACAADPPRTEARPTRPTGVAPPTRIPDVVTDAPAPAGQPMNIASLPRETRRAVVADAARRFGVDASAVVLTRAEQVTWPDGSLGCPEPGQYYTQVLVTGYRLTAKTSDGELVYHTDSRGNVKSCGVLGKPPHESLKDRKSVEPVTQPPDQKPDR
jgi:hypothetical protein